MKSYQIQTDRGLVIGVFDADSPEGAMDKMVAEKFPYLKNGQDYLDYFKATLDVNDFRIIIK